MTDPEFRTLRGMRRASTQLIDALRDSDWDVRFLVTLGLVHTHDSRAIHAVVATFANTEINDSNSGPQYLAENGGPHAFDAVVAALGDPNPHVRLVAAHALRYTNNATTFPALIRAEKDSEVTIREAAKLALSGCPRPIPD
jgi:HEAT repeat protein